MNNIIYIYIYRLAILLGVVSIVGCATMTNGPKQKVSINTNTGEKVIARVNGKKTITPAEIVVSRVKGANIEVLHKDNPCFEDTRYSISGKAKMSGLFWLNFFGLGFFGSTTDAVSGGMWEYNDPNFIIPVGRIPNCKAKAPNLDSETSHEIESKTNSKKVDSKNKI